MALINRRQQDILNELEQKGYVNVVDLCETHNVSTVTIRKDLNFLENELLHQNAWNKQKPVYAFERNVDDKEANASEANRRRGIKIYK
jgi:DeoR/GlpR family transcriptional regulator of sugar metabolism